MKGVQTDEILDESLLRRALRLDSDELPPRLDAAAIAAAERSPTRRVLVLVALTAAALLAAGVGALVGVAELALAWWAGDPLGDVVLDRAIALAVAVAVPLSDLLGTLASPTTAIVSLAVVAFAVFHERTQERERVHVGAS